jgi:hypothetical protein
MKKAIVLLTALLSLSAFAETPYDKFTVIDEDMLSAKHFTLESKITWIFTKNVNWMCELQAKKFKTKPFNVGNKTMDGCAFWDKDSEGKDVCTIVTNIKTDYWTLGHEVRHCFHGGFHK